MKTILAAAGMFISTLYFVVNIIKYKTDYYNQFECFKDKYFPTQEEQEKAGNKKMQKEFNQLILGYYAFAALTLYGFIFLLEIIIERWKS